MTGRNMAAGDFRAVLLKTNGCIFAVRPFSCFHKKEVRMIRSVPPYCAVFLSDGKGFHHMMISTAYQGYDKTYIHHYRFEDLGPLERELLKHYDARVSDLFALSLNIIHIRKMTTRQDLFQLEKEFNTRNHLLTDYSGDIDHGAVLSIEQIRDRIFRDMWISYVFMERTDMSAELIRIFRTVQKTADTDELLFWTFRFCAWGGQENRLPYTMFLKLTDGSFERFYDSCPEWHDLLQII